MTTIAVSDPPDHLGADEGERRRDAELTRLAQTRRVVHRLLQRAAVQIAIHDESVSADQVRSAVPIPAGISPNVTGAAFRHLAVAGVLRATGYAQSCRPAAHAGMRRVWALTDRA